MEPATENVPLVYAPDSGTLFEVKTWGWDGIYFRAVLAQNQNDISFKNGWSPQSLSYIDIFLHCLYLKWFIIVLLQSTSRAMKDAGMAMLTLGDLLHYLGLCILMST